MTEAHTTTEMPDLAQFEGVSTIGHWQGDLKSENIFWSSAMFRIFGRDPETFVPMHSTILSCLVPQERKLFQDKMDDVVRTGSGFEIECEIVTQDGRKRYVLIVGSGSREADGTLVGLVGYARDITKRKIEEIKLRRDREQLDYAFAAANAALWDWDLDEDTLTTSPRFAEIVDANPKTWKPSMTLHNRICHPDDLPRMQDAIREHIAGRGVYDIEYRLRRNDGEYVWIHSRGQAVRDEKGRAHRVIGSVTDVTDRRRDQEALRRNEETLELAIQASRAGYFDRRWDQEDIYWSPRLREILGITDSDYMPNMKAFNDRVHPEDRDRLAASVTAYQRADESLDTECRLQRDDGVYIWVQIRATIQRDDNGNPMRAIGFVIDINDRKKLELELEAQTKLFQDVATAAGEYIWEFDRHGKFTYVSDKVQDVLGYSADEVVGRSPLEFMTREDARAYRKALVQLMRHGEGFKAFEVPGFKSDKSVVWQRLSGTPILDRAGVVQGYRGVAQDITAQKQAELAVVRSEMKFRDLIEGSIQGLVIHRKYKPLFINDAYAQMLGYDTAEDMLSNIKSMLDLLPAVFAEKADAFWQRSMSGELDGQVIRGSHIDRNGRTVWTDAVGRVVDWDGEPAFQITVIDVTEQHDIDRALKESEELFRVVAENASDLITIPRDGGIVTYASPSAFPITGYTPDELIGSDTNTLIYEDDLLGLEEARQRRESGAPVGDAPMRWRLRRKDGRLIWLETTISELPRLEDETGSRVLSISRDVTDRVERERELEAARDRLTRQAGELTELAARRDRLTLQAGELTELAARLDQERDRAEKANVAKSQFLAMMSHELRTPMTGVLGMVDLLTGTKVDDHQKDLLSTLHRSASALLDLLNDILDFSKIEAGELELEIVDFSMSSIVKDVRELFDPVLSAKGLNLAVTMDGVDEDVLRGDPTRIRQVLMNLIGNASKFTEVGGVRVTVSQASTLSGDITMRFDIADTGIGVAAEDQAPLFQPFVQAESDTTRKFGGTGLGLAICKQLVEAMGGTIWVESELGQGSVFSFSIATQAGDPEKVIDQASPVDLGRAIILQPLSFLVAEDNPTTQMLLRSMLERDGHRVTVVNNGALAVAEVERSAFDIILMDMQMPVMDGPEAIRRIRAMTTTIASCPVIALTADAIRTHRQRYLDAGANVVVTKPVNWSELFTEVARLTGADLSYGAVAEASSDSPDAEYSADEEDDLLDPTMIEVLVDALDEETMATMLVNFKNNMQKYAAELEQLAVESDLEQSKRTAHALKGLTAQFGAIRVSNMAKTIEESVQSVAELESILPGLRQSVLDTISVLDERG
jgi:PAS domain S-box-containing protein